MEKKRMVPSIVEIIKETCGLHEAEKVAVTCSMLKKVIAETRFLNFCLKAHLKSQSWVMGDVSLVDFFFYEACFYIAGFLEPYIKNDPHLNGFNSFCKLFESLEFLKKGPINRMKIFFPFKNQQMMEILVNAWNGSEEQQIV